MKWSDDKIQNIPISSIAFNLHIIIFVKTMKFMKIKLFAMHENGERDCRGER